VSELNFAFANSKVDALLSNQITLPSGTIPESLAVILPSPQPISNIGSLPLKG